ncbi:hypothetical protein HPB48_008897 [Haemaphysalis longicornis]|uniref:Reverse transcriptase domain-containing protein n=1 Tax=Haemaphysalis longicornis TaxID=44386 RepID=A0A9J6H103_HAELO|nr:hypothetical protein HPB48_008897 [Haemaphysalis longicornis]
MRWQSGVHSLAVLQLDLKKVFDQVDHAFLFMLLGQCGIGDATVEWINICYTEITTGIIMNGERE